MNVLQRLMYKLFDYDYVFTEYSFRYHVVRVRTFPNGLRYVKIYGKVIPEGETKWVWVTSKDVSKEVSPIVSYNIQPPSDE